MKLVHSQEYTGKSRPDLQGKKITADCTVFEEVLEALRGAGFDADKALAFGQHLEALTAHYSATKAAGALKAQKEGDKGISKRAGFTWDNDTATLVATLIPWQRKASKEDKQRELNAAIEAKVDAQIEAGVVPKESRAVLLTMMGWKPV